MGYFVEIREDMVFASQEKAPLKGEDRMTSDLDEPRFRHLSNEVLAMLQSEFPRCPEAYELFDQFFGHETYDRGFSEVLIDRSRQSGGSRWAIRRLALLMLNHQLSILPEENLMEFEFMITRLGIKQPGGPVSESVLKEGYSTNELLGFVTEFKRRLARVDRVTRLIHGERTSAAAVREFIHLSRHECRLMLARYLWTPEEVVERILTQVRLSRAAKDTRPIRHPYLEQEAELTLSNLPEFESQILRRLQRMSRIFWVSNSISSRINALVEYPLTTVVLVLKLPGSDTEIELKRAGDRGEHPLTVYYARAGEPVPVTHRLHAGSMGEYLRWDAGASAILSRIYRLVHGIEAPIPKTISVSTIYTVPTDDGEQHILRYFTDSRVFGERFGEMRRAMAESINAFKRERDWTPPKVDGDLGLTAQFLSVVAPGQAILAGTTSFRLDRLARYLSPSGPDYYFRDGLKTEFTDADAKLFLDDILDEVFGTYTPPGVSYQNPEQYLRAAFAVPCNRELAEKNYLTMMSDIGTLWGALMALGGFTRGESFVARNVGLRTVWENGRWRVKIIFMDHDDLDIAGSNATEFYPRAALPAMADDELHIFGGTSCGEKIKGEVAFLEEIYRISPDISRQGYREIMRAIENSYKKTRHELAHNKKLRAFFSESFIEQVTDWESVVSSYLIAGKEPSAVDAWKTATRDFLGNKGYNVYRIYDLFCAIDSSDDFLNRYSFLF
jgi:hypothetical protein